MQRDLAEFRAAAIEAVQHLADAFPLAAWLVALTDASGGWTPVAAVDSHYGVVVGESLAWQDTICSRMVQGLGPHVSARVEADAAYAQAQLGRDLGVGAYVGTALLGPGGEVLGTLCGIDPAPQPAGLHDALPIATVLAGVLSRLLGAERQAALEPRRGRSTPRWTRCGAR